MKKLVFVGLIIINGLFIYSCNPPIRSSSFIHNNIQREYVLYKPSNLPNNAPLVLVLHSYGRYAINHMESLQLNEVADTNMFAVYYPQGTLDENTGSPYWNARLHESNFDDVGFLTELAKHLQTKYNLDPIKTFVCGISNGGFMSYTLACESPKTFKAIASVTGTMSGYTWNHRNSTSLPVPVLQISGIDDQIVPIDGSMSTEYGWGGAPHMDTVMNYWKDFNQCKTIDTLFILPNVYGYHFKNGINENQVWYYKIADFGHDLPSIRNSGLNTAELIWDFFKTIE
ncbi:PHB depolymerase family esterase [Tamlana sp. 2201CG12-4]|uniref:alpha/beta hydrolase family esterase n=1 Tax=Tamlana sp. 2201CG12-4 TaxID=3112582 RepID=UPI002DBF0E68|nr:PHB depolymerase family esterase [Tamlana sp. 2201CG12-4]MEC3907036.1 PHB depolymerase family esterase [Tamlana sp. 2201CG12-4]